MAEKRTVRFGKWLLKVVISYAVFIGIGWLLGRIPAEKIGLSEDMFFDLRMFFMLFGPMPIDTVGMNTLFLPDLQYHFHDMDPNWVVNHAYNVASYILEHDNPIQDGETIDGVVDGQLNQEIQWKCQYEEALIQPPRGVLNIHMGKYAAGQD